VSATLTPAATPILGTHTTTDSIPMGAPDAGIGGEEGLASDDTSSDADGVPRWELDRDGFLWVGRARRACQTDLSGPVCRDVAGAAAEGAALFRGACAAATPPGTPLPASTRQRRSHRAAGSKGVVATPGDESGSASACRGGRRSRRAGDGAAENSSCASVSGEDGNGSGRHHGLGGTSGSRNASSRAGTSRGDGHREGSTASIGLVYESADAATTPSHAASAASAMAQGVGTSVNAKGPSAPGSLPLAAPPSLDSYNASPGTRLLDSRESRVGPTNADRVDDEATAQQSGDEGATPTVATGAKNDLTGRKHPRRQMGANGQTRSGPDGSSGITAEGSGGEEEAVEAAAGDTGAGLGAVARHSGGSRVGRHAGVRGARMGGDADSTSEDALGPAHAKGQTQHGGSARSDQGNGDGASDVAAAATVAACDADEAAGDEVSLKNGTAATGTGGRQSGEARKKATLEQAKIKVDEPGLLPCVIPFPFLALLAYVA